MIINKSDANLHTLPTNPLLVVVIAIHFVIRVKAMPVNNVVAKRAIKKITTTCTTQTLLTIDTIVKTLL
jgi:hypothetical protein